MISLSRKTDYALAALAYLAASESERTRAREIAEEVNLPLPALMNILKGLTHRGFVDAVRGPRGGYRLARDANEISLAEMIEAVEGPQFLTRCCDSKPANRNGACQRVEDCTIKESLQAVNRKICDILTGVTLAQIVAGEV